MKSFWDKLMSVFFKQKHQKRVRHKLINRFSGIDQRYDMSTVTNFLIKNSDGTRSESEIKALLNKAFDGGGNILLGLLDEELVGAVVIDHKDKGKENAIDLMAFEEGDTSFKVKQKLLTSAIRITKGKVIIKNKPEDRASKFWKDMEKKCKRIELVS